jgi:hypothetical protein
MTWALKDGHDMHNLDVALAGIMIKYVHFIFDVFCEMIIAFPVITLRLV